MPYSAYLLRYFYVWITAVVLITDVLTGFRGSMEIQTGDISVSMRIWQFMLGLALFLILIGVIHVWIDHSGRAFPRRVKILHLAVSVLFSIVMFIYLQILETRRLDNPKRYFQADQLRYWEEANIAMAVLILVFLVAQVLFVFYLIRIMRRPALYMF